MTEKCFDIGTIQAFLDGELSSDKMESVSRHIAVCDGCAISMAEAQEESAFAFSALEQEFNTLVPTQRLWTKINDSIEKEKKSFWKPIFAFFSNPSVAAFASLLIVIGFFAAMLSLKTDAPTTLVAETLLSKENSIAPISKSYTPIIQTPIESNKPEIVSAMDFKNDKSKHRAVKAKFIKREVKQIKNITPNTAIGTPSPSDNSGQRTANENVLGEESYVKTIATLTETVNNGKDEVLKPAARFAFERDLAVTDDAIKKMSAEVKQNPKNEAAKQILRASYQNKIDLLNSVAEKTELMASIK
ncbi:MAG: hypothetical protein H0X49_09160 [Acidobacteria bacterium]|nr:hypothetical protein [Acidobacteriota bacterium]